MDIKGVWFDEFREQWILEENFVTQQILVDEEVVKSLKTDHRLRRLLYEVSDDIHFFVLRQSRSRSIPYKKQLMKEDERTIKALTRAMLAQVRYNLRSGGGMLKDQTGINLENMRKVSLEDLRGERFISQTAIDILNSEVPYLMYRG